MTLDPIAGPTLTDDEIDCLRSRGEEATFADGDALWCPGDVEFCFFVVLSGGVIIRNEIGDLTPLTRHGVGNFTGDVDVMTGRPAPLGGYADGETRVLQISAEQLRDVVRVEQDLGGKILRAFIRRREILLDSPDHGILLVGSGFDPETMALRTFLSRNRVVYRWRQPEEPETAKIMDAFGLTAKDTPIVFSGQRRFTHPTIEALGEDLGIRFDTDHAQVDLLIIGAGPAGLAAAVYGASEGLETLLLDRSGPGGQASWSSRIENYMGFTEGLTGSELAARGLLQAQKFGAKVSIPADVAKIESAPGGHLVHLAGGEIISARAVIVATGASYQKLPISGFERFETSGVYYAATKIEADFCSESDVVVVGGGNSAGQAAVFLSRIAKKVYLVVRGKLLNAAMSDYLSYRVEQTPNIEVCLETQVSELEGDDRLRRACFTGKHAKVVDCDGLFVFVGATANTSFLKDTVALDRHGFVLTGDSMRASWDEARIPFYLETSMPGIFAAGDCRTGSVKRVASSVGEGSMAVTFIHRYLSL